MTRHQTISAIAACVLVLALTAQAHAHAFLDHADPKVGAADAKAPDQVRIWFSQEIESAFSVIQVFDSDGKQVDKKDSRRDDKDKTLLTVSLEKLPPGTYKVHWRVVSTDTHPTEGDFKFTVKAPEEK